MLLHSGSPHSSWSIAEALPAPATFSDTRNLIEFNARFDKEEACREYFFQRRCPNGSRCPRYEIRHGTEGVPEEASDHVGASVDDLVAQGLAGFDSSGFGLPDTPDGRALHPEKCSASAGRLHRREVAKDTRLCGTDKKIA